VVTVAYLNTQLRELAFQVDGGNVSAGGKRITHVGTPLNAADAVTLQHLKSVLEKTSEGREQPITSAFLRHEVLRLINVGLLKLKNEVKNDEKSIKPALSRTITILMEMRAKMMKNGGKQSDGEKTLNDQHVAG